MRSAQQFLKRVFIPVLFISVFSAGYGYSIELDVDQDWGIIVGNGKITTISTGDVESITKTNIKDDDIIVKTDGVFYCTAFCMQGRTKKGARVRALYHWDSIVPAYRILRVLKEMMIKVHGAERRSISTIFYGTRHSAEDWKDELMYYRHYGNIQDFYADQDADGDIIGINVYMHPEEISLSYVETEYREEDFQK